MIDPFRRIDRWMFSGGWARQVWVLRTGLAVLLVLRIALWPFANLAHAPSALFRPPPIIDVLVGPPDAWLIIGVQVVGVLAGLVAIARPRSQRVGFAVCWVAFLFLAALKTSMGKILHNDVLLVLVAVPVLFAPRATRTGTRFGTRYGWPLNAALAVVATVYFACAWQKLVHTGVSWALSDNMRWILYAAAASGRAPTDRLAIFMADRLWLSMVAASVLLLLELSFPLVLFFRWVRPYFMAAVVGLHAGTWLTLGLDYWAWAATAALVLWLSWARPTPPSLDARDHRVGGELAPDRTESEHDRAYVSHYRGRG